MQIIGDNFHRLFMTIINSKPWIDWRMAGTVYCILMLCWATSGQSNRGANMEAVTQCSTVPVSELRRWSKLANAKEWTSDRTGCSGVCVDTFWQGVEFESPPDIIPIERHHRTTKELHRYLFRCFSSSQKRSFMAMASRPCAPPTLASPFSLIDAQSKNKHYIHAVGPHTPPKPKTSTTTTAPPPSSKPDPVTPSVLHIGKVWPTT